MLHSTRLATLAGMDNELMGELPEMGEVEEEMLDNEEEEDEAEDEGDVDDAVVGGARKEAVDVLPSGASGATALAIAPMIKFWLDACDMLVPPMLLLLDAGAGDEGPMRFKSTWSGLTMTALCMTWRYAAPRRDLRSSSSESVIAR